MGGSCQKCASTYEPHSHEEGKMGSRRSNSWTKKRKSTVAREAEANKQEDALDGCSTDMASPLSLNEVLQYLSGTMYKEKYKRNFPATVTRAVEVMARRAKDSERAADMLYTFAEKMKDEKKVRIISSGVPPGILPHGLSATLHDIKVDARESDDEIYNNHVEIRKLIARGNTTMKLTGKINQFDVVLYGNKKFTGGVGDEDEQQPDTNDLWREFCLEDPDKASQVVCITKLNGEAAHFSGRYINGQFYLVTGSKNVHMLIRNKEDIEKYGEPRRAVAMFIAKCVCDALEKLEDQKRNILYAFLHHTKCTVVNEILQPTQQHIVDLSYLNEPQLNVITVTPVLSDDEESSLTALPPHHTIDIFKMLGFSTADYHIIKASEVIPYKEEVRKMVDSEGYVFYFLNEHDQTTGLVKVKTTWYIVLRALREKAAFSFAEKRKDAVTLDVKIKSIRKRFEEIQAWLKFSDVYLDGWNNLGESFLRWLDSQINAEEEKSAEIRPRFPVIWKRFLASDTQKYIIPQL